jgi:CDP-4-dehydro-6-deoxyglucose reductase, E1
MSASIQDLIREVMSKSASSQEQSEYWYPLAKPSFGSEEVLEALESMTSYRTTMWEKTRTFESAFAQYVGAEAVMVNSGSSADLLLVYSLLTSSGGVLKPGDEVLVPSVTWPTQLWSVAMAGLTPVLVDIDPQTLNMKIESIREKITSKTKAIFVVHLMGNPADLNSITKIAEEHDLIVIEDCCESLGALVDGKHVGTQSWGGTFSFFFSHHICTMEGGMIVTSDSETAERLRLLRAHGWARNLKNQNHDLLKLTKDPALDPRYTFLEWGFNVRPTELQAGFGIHQLKKFPAFKEARRVCFNAVKESLSDLPHVKFPRVESGAEPCWFAIPIMLSKDAPVTRNEVTSRLQRNGVETRPIVAGNLALQPVRRRFEWLRDDNLPGASEIHSSGFYIGLHGVSDLAETKKLIELLKRCLS